MNNTVDQDTGEVLPDEIWDVFEELQEELQEELDEALAKELLENQKREDDEAYKRAMEIL